MSGQSRVQDIYPLSPLQEVMFVETRNAPETTAYLDHLVLAIDHAGGLDTDAFKGAIDAVVMRHEALRTVFATTPRQQPQQIVLRHVEVPIHEEDWSGLNAEDQERHLDAFLATDRRRPYDLARPPLLRVALLRRGEGYYFVLSYHHIILDGWSVSLVFEEICRLYSARVRGTPIALPAPRPYRSYIEWIRRLGRGSSHAFWRRQLAGFTKPTPLFGALADAGTGRPPAGIGEVETRLSADVTTKLRETARSAGLTLNTLVQAAWAIQLAHTANEDEVLFGSVVSGRPPDLQGMETMVGLFTNTIPVRVRVPLAGSLRTWLQRFQAEDFERYQHAWTPLSDVHALSEVPRDRPLFESAIIFQNYARNVDAATTGTFDVDVVRHDFRNTLALSLMVSPEARLRLRFRFDDARLGMPGVARQAAAVESLLERMATSVEMPIASLDTLSHEMRMRVVHEWNASAVRHPNADPVHVACAVRSGVVPDRVAITCGDRHLSYGELRRRVSALASRLRACHAGPEARVCVAVPRGPGLIVGLLAILEARLAYVPLDPLHPPSRLERTLVESGAEIVLVDEEAREGWLELVQRVGRAAHVLSVDETADSERVAPAIPAALPMEQLAYVLFTSGSTGAPKGAMITHEGLHNHLWAKVEALDLTSADVVAQTASAAFDISIWQMLAPLLVGGCVHIMPDEAMIDPIRLLRDVEGRAVSVLEVVPSMLKAMLAVPAAERPPLATLRWLIATGEELPPVSCRRWLVEYPRVRVMNAYGPTECSDDVTHHVIEDAPPEDALRVPIGRPIANTQLHLWNRWDQPAGVDVVGELFVGGTGVGRGYLNDPRKTAERFVPDPTSPVPGRRLYRTGDLAKWRSDGTLDFLGRRDYQVKIRGFRIELGEIEATLERCREVRSAAVVVRSVATGEHHLVAYVVPSGATDEQDDPPDADARAGRLEQWRAVFDDVYRGATWSEQDAAVNFDLWMDSYSARPFTDAEVAESVNDSVARILEGAPRRVLEVGCGTGLLFARLARQCTYYCGTDFSAAALDAFRERTRASLGPVDCEIELIQAPAHDVTRLAGRTFDVVVLNEIAQYFPDGEYLLRVLDAVAPLVRPGGRLFIGGVRNLHLLPAFHASVQLGHAPPEQSIEQLGHLTRLRQARDKELVIAPAFFAALRQRIPTITRIDVRPKGGRFRNEFTKFRYDVVCHTGPCEDGAEPPSVDWSKHEWTLDRARTWLQATRPESLRITGVPNARTARDAATVRLLEEAALGTVQRLRHALEEEPETGVDPDVLTAVASALGYVAWCSWVDTDETGRYDVSLSRVAAMPPVVQPSRPWDPTQPSSAYVNRSADKTDEGRVIRALQKALRRALPEHVVPHEIVLLPVLPLTPNGKVDRQMLERLDRPRPESSRAARTATEQLAIDIWSDVLGTSDVGLETNFFEAGGHSLLATQVHSRVQRAVGRELPLRSIFDAPTPAAFAGVLDAELRNRHGLASPPPLEPTAAADKAGVLSFAQERLWVTVQLDDDPATYNIPAAVRIEGALRRAALDAATAEVVRRHEALRTRFVVEADRPVTQVAPPPAWTSPLVDLVGVGEELQQRIVRRLGRAEAARGFALDCRPPLRTRLLRLAPDVHVLLITMHHIVSDGWSMGIFVRELIALYRHFADGEVSSLPELAVQYSDYAVWQRRWLSGERFDRHLSYWKRQLAALPPPGVLLPPRRKGGVESDGVCQLALPSSIADAVKKLGREEQATSFIVLLAAVASLLYRSSGRADVVIGTDVACRTARESEDLIGFFVNLLMLRTSLAGRPSFREVIARTRTVALDAYAHQDLPFDLLVRELRPDRRAAHGEPFDLLVVFQHALNAPAAHPDLRWQPVALDASRARFDLVLYLEERRHGLTGGWQYRGDVYDEAAVRSLSKRFEALLASGLSAPDTPVDDLDWLRVETKRTRGPLHDSSAARFERSVSGSL